MELVVPGDLFYKGAIILKQDKVAQKIEQIGWRKDTTNQGFKLAELTERVQSYTINGSPGHKAFNICREGTHKGLGAV